MVVHPKTNQNIRKQHMEHFKLFGHDQSTQNGYHYFNVSCRCFDYFLYYFYLRNGVDVSTDFQIFINIIK